MPRRLARTAGIIGLLIFVLIVGGDIESRAGGDAMPQPIRSIALVTTAVCTIVWWTGKLIDNAMLRYAGTVTAEVAAASAVGIDEDTLARAMSRVSLDEETMRAVIKDVVADMFNAALEEKMNEIYRLGMVSGAAHYARPYIVPPAEDGE